MGRTESLGIDGSQASAKGVRHAYAIECMQKGIPLNLVSKWLGHASLTTTAIYADALGEEERAIAARLWNNKQPLGSLQAAVSPL